MSKIVLASNNSGKLREFNKLFSKQGIEVLPQSSFDLESVEETGLSFVENAILKARHAAKYTGLAAIADDSGIEVDALDGAPGIYSARFSGAGASDEDNNNKLLAELEKLPHAPRTARYQCILVYMKHEKDPTPVICQAAWEGEILTEPRGEGGFGYDPLFFLPKLNCSAAELSPDLKNTISHRAIALNKLMEALFS